MHEWFVKELREAEKEAKELYTNPYRFVPYYGKAADIIEALEFTCDIYDKDYKALWEYVPKWIPVTERLPEEFQPVWVACKMDGRENWTFDTVYDPYLKCPWGSYYYLEKGEAVVYAWMDRSAPEPPKGETK